MTTFNTVIKKRNPTNDGWDSILPITTAENVLINEEGDSVATHLAKKATDEALGHVKSDGVTTTIDANGVIKCKRKETTSAITYYVRTNGNDSNDGSADDAAHAFKTIKKATSLLEGLTAKHTITINIKTGTYAEGIDLKNIISFSTISLVADGGDVTLTGESSTGSVAAISISNLICNCVYFDKGSGAFKIKPVSAFGTSFYGLYSFADCMIYAKLKIDCDTWPVGITNKYGISVSDKTKVVLKSGTIISNCYGGALCATGLGEITTGSGTGTGNNIGYIVYSGGKIFISATSGNGHIAGTTQKERHTGGLIVDPNGLIT